MSVISQAMPVGTTPVSKPEQPQILMCPPEYFELAYAINPWMSLGEPLDQSLVQQQWQQLRRAVEAAGAHVHQLGAVERLPDLVFTANAAFVIGSTAWIAHYKHTERQGEEPYAQAWFAANGFDVQTFSDDIYFEGAGDALIWLSPVTDQPVIFAGYGTRSDIRAHHKLAEQSGLEVVSLELTDPRFYHIDVCLCPLETGHLIYYPGALTAAGLAEIEKRVPEAFRIVLDDQDAAGFGCNAVNIGQSVIVNQAATGLAQRLRQLELKPVLVDLSEFIKAGGSAKCLTLRVG